MNKIPPFFVGQEVVAIRDHSIGIVKKGQEFTVLGIKRGCCIWIVDVGIENYGFKNRCVRCGNVRQVDKKRLYIGATLFAPKDQFKAISFTKVMETELTSAN